MRLFYGWIIAVSALLILGVTNGLIIGGINVFDESLLDAFGWSRADLKFRDLLTFAIAGLLGPFAGALADRLGVRRLMLFGSVLLAACFFFYSRIQSIGQMYAIHVLFAVVLATAGLIVNVMLVSRWFLARRGTAIGIALVGTSLGGVFFPQLGTRLIQSSGWRQAFVVEAFFPIALVVLILLLVRNSPAERNLKPLGATADAGAAPSAATELTGMEYGAALRTGTFWALAFAAMMTFYSILGAQAHLFLHLRGLGFSPATASTGLSTLYLLALVGKFAFGLLADQWNQKRVFLANIGVMLAGAVLLATLKAGLFWPAVILFGLGWGGLYTLLQLLTVDSFGLKASGKILGTITVLDAIGGGLGIWLTGLLYDKTGSYQLPFGILVVLLTLALAAATQVRKQVATAS